jgi:predicted RNA-binding protein YlqC (UPF0109 family)
VAVRVSFVEARRSLRLENHLSQVLSQLMPRKGFANELACDVRVRKEKGNGFRGENQFSCAIHVHGNKKVEHVVVGKGGRITEAIREALKKIEGVMGREHERIIRNARRRSRVGTLALREVSSF